MEKKVLFGLGMVIVFVVAMAFAAEWKETEISRLLEFPRKIEIIPPDKDLDPRIAALSGRWEGIWRKPDDMGGEFPVMLIVESIQAATKAKIIYCYGKDRKGWVKPGYERNIAKIISGEKVKILFPYYISVGGKRQWSEKGLELGEDLKKLISETLVLKKIED
jgi:hypothetical protein